jgi:hypothetical protein
MLHMTAALPAPAIEVLLLFYRYFAVESHYDSSLLLLGVRDAG